MDHDVGGFGPSDAGRPAASLESGLQAWTVPERSARTQASADLDLIAASYEAAARSRTWRDLLSDFCDRFEATAGALCEHDFVTGRGALHRDFNIRPAFRDAYNAGLSRENPWVESSAHYRRLSVSLGTEICSDDRLTESAFHEKFLAPQGLLHRLCGVVSNRGGRVQYISLLRGPADRPFDQADRASLGHLLPYIGRSLTLRKKLRRGHRESNDLRGLLARLPLACLLVDRAARLLFQNPAAERLLEGASGVGTRSGRVVAGSPRDSARLQRLISAIAVGDGDRAGEHLLLPHATGPLPLLCALFPLVGPDAAASEPDQHRVALLIKDLQEEGPSSAEDFADAFGLTKAEARLVALLGEGAALFEAAATLGVTRSTARTHMRNIYAKIGANRQTDVVRLLERFTLF